ncbi:hypothetical protein FQA39_LY19437 [Lamprigera yunnana]|nr:hypothetical protein FQA39_LY19437 [Lamprigera yunnana]
MTEPEPAWPGRREPAARRGADPRIAAWSRPQDRKTARSCIVLKTQGAALYAADHCNEPAQDCKVEKRSDEFADACWKDHCRKFQEVAERMRGARQLAELGGPAKADRRPSEALPKAPDRATRAQATGVIARNQERPRNEQGP